MSWGTSEHRALQLLSISSVVSWTEWESLRERSGRRSIVRWRRNNPLRRRHYGTTRSRVNNSRRWGHATVHVDLSGSCPRG